MFGLSRRERLQSSLRDAHAAWAAADANTAEALFQRAARLADPGEQPLARGRALLGVARAKEMTGDARGAAEAAADAAACFVLAGDQTAGQTALGVDGASPLLVSRSLLLAEQLALKGDATGYATVAQGLMKMTWGQDAELTADVALRLCSHAITLKRPDLCAQCLFFSAGALRVLAMREDLARLGRATDLAVTALGRASTPGALDEAGEVADERDVWVLALSELVVELSEPRLDPLRRARAHLVRARVLLDQGRPEDAKEAALIAVARARASLGDDDPMTAEARHVLAVAEEQAPDAQA